MKVVDDGSACGEVWASFGSGSGEPSSEGFLDRGGVVISDDFTDKGELSFQDLLRDGGDVVEGFSNVFVFYVLVADVLPCDLLDSADGSVME